MVAGTGRRIDGRERAIASVAKPSPGWRAGRLVLARIRSSAQRAGRPTRTIPSSHRHIPSGKHPDRKPSSGEPPALANCVSSGHANDVVPLRHKRRPGKSARDCRLLIRRPYVKASSCVRSVYVIVSGGAWASWVGRIVCARAPMLTSVLDPRVGSGAGDKMLMGCCSRWGKRCGRSIFLGRPRERVGSDSSGAGRGASV